MKLIVFILFRVLVMQGYDDAVKKLEEDGAKAETTIAKYAIGDSYVKLIGKYPKKRQDLLDLASPWYEKSWSDLDGFHRGQLKEKLGKLYSPIIPGRAGGVPQGWGGPLDGKSKAEILATCVHSGGVAARLISAGSGNLASVLRSPQIQIQPGKKLEVSAWILTEGTDGLGDGLNAHVSDAGGKLLTSIVFTMKPDLPIWTKVSQEIVAPDTAFKLQVDIVLGSKKGCVWVDDISVKSDGKESLKNGGFEDR